MFSGTLLAEVRERFLQLANSDDAEFLRTWRIAINREIAEHICDNVKPTITDFTERMALLEVDYRSQIALSAAAGITHSDRILVQRQMLDANSIMRVLSCCTGQNIALSAELVRMLLDYAPQQIPLAADHLVQLCHQSTERPADREADQMSVRGLAFLTLCEGGTQYAPAVLEARQAQQECIETLWNWRLVSTKPARLYRYEDAVNTMMAEIRGYTKSM